MFYIGQPRFSFSNCLFRMKILRVGGRGSSNPVPARRRLLVPTTSTAPPKTCFLSIPLAAPTSGLLQGTVGNWLKLIDNRCYSHEPFELWNIENPPRNLKKKDQKHTRNIKKHSIFEKKYWIFFRFGKSLIVPKNPKVDLLSSQGPFPSQRFEKWVVPFDQMKFFLQKSHSAEKPRFQTKKQILSCVYCNSVRVKRKPYLLNLAFFEIRFIELKNHSE